ncbi:hypothetical protein QBC45DRAFT_41078 [Copromyces sp. CBS 386.78]|nr:hypothetical protein QBC45DRAFT_41078 [Copromyces sp. CBS 386.78]
MPLSLDTPVLQVDANVIHKVDTTNPANLFSMWTVFARCRDSVHQGRRLENLSWRLWNRETFCCESEVSEIESSATCQPQDIQRYPGGEDMPQLSGSVDSALDEEAVDFGNDTDAEPLDYHLRPRIQRQDSCASNRSRGRERHITSGDLEKMVVSIIEAKTPLNAPLPSIALVSPPVEETKPAPIVVHQLERSGSTTTESSCNTSENPSMESLQTAASVEAASQLRPTIITRGFSVSPSQLPIIQRASAHASRQPSPSVIPEPTAAPAAKPVQPKKQQARFALGASNSGDDSYTDREQSFDHRKQQIPLPPKKKMFQVGRGSSEEEESPRDLKRTVALNKQVVIQDSSAISDDSDSDYVDESAIDDDDDSSEWEDSVEESGKSSVDDKFNFQRVDSKVNLTSRRSLITLMLHNNTRAQKLGNIASQSTSAIPRARAQLNGPSMVPSPSDSDEAPLMMRGKRAPPMRPINEIPRSAAQPINAVATGIHHQACLSPRTTRRNMLATELTESLRRNLLWERSHKNSTATAVLKRRHTSQDVANLKQYPERACMKDDNDKERWDQYFNKNAYSGYHAQGW